MSYSDFSKAARDAAAYLNIEEVKTTKIDETEFARSLIRQHKLIFCNNQFYCADGMTSEIAVRNLIYQEVRKSGIKRSVSSLVSRLLECVKLEATTLKLPVSENLIRFKNGTLRVSTNEFIKKPARIVTIIPHSYNPAAPAPEKFQEFLRGLIRDDDMPVVQEFIGYLFLPTTRAQKALFILGEGQEGKSVLGAVIRHILGTNAEVGKVHCIENDKFFLGNLEGKLAFIDDDFDASAISSTGTLKELITCTGEMSVQKKFEQSHPAKMFARVDAKLNRKQKNARTGITDAGLLHNTELVI